MHLETSYLGILCVEDGFNEQHIHTPVQQSSCLSMHKGSETGQCVKQSLTYLLSIGLCNLHKGDVAEVGSLDRG